MSSSALAQHPVRHLSLAPLTPSVPSSTYPPLTGGLTRPSKRERDVLALVADGFSTREVALRLCYSERTIKNILQNVTNRLALRNRTQAVAYAVRCGWI